MYTKITPKFQVHIAEKSRIVIKLVKSSILDLAGKYRVKNPIPAEKIRNYIDYAWGKR